MELHVTKEQIILDKELNDLDKFVLEFVAILDRCKIKYVIISGYVAILFGRSRSSEDVDMFIEQLSQEQFAKLWYAVTRERFECMNTTDQVEAFAYLTSKHAIRLHKEGIFFPNMEMKFPKLPDEAWALTNRKRIVLNNHELFTSPIEAQIAFKLELGSEKDYEDARHLYNILHPYLDKQLLGQSIKKHNVQLQAQRYLYDRTLP